jgi:hypothetical protein
MGSLTYQARRSRKRKTHRALRISRYGCKARDCGNYRLPIQCPAKTGGNRRKIPEREQCKTSRRHREGRSGKRGASFAGQGCARLTPYIGMIFLRCRIWRDFMPYLRACTEINLDIMRHFSKIYPCGGNLEESAGFEAGLSRHWQKARFEVIQRRKEHKPARRRAVTLLTAV